MPLAGRLALALLLPAPARASAACAGQLCHTPDAADRLISAEADAASSQLLQTQLEPHASIVTTATREAENVGTLDKWLPGNGFDKQLPKGKKELPTASPMKATGPASDVEQSLPAAGLAMPPDELSLLELGASAEVGEPLSFKKCAAEFIAMTLFVIFGCGSAMSIAKDEGSAWVLQVSLSFGLAITVIAYAVGHYSGGHINGAVSFGLWIAGKLSCSQMVLNVVAQLFGATFGAVILKIMYGDERDKTESLGTNAVAPGWTPVQALVGEIMGTFLLMFVVLEHSTNPIGCLCIGAAVFLAHSVLIPVDGCSINPTRTFGPALVQAMTKGSFAPFDHMWVFWFGPAIGAALAAAFHLDMTTA